MTIGGVLPFTAPEQTDADVGGKWSGLQSFIFPPQVTERIAEKKMLVAFVKNIYPLNYSLIIFTV